MNEDILAELAHGLLKTVEAADATDDILALLCIHFAEASPGPATELAQTLRRMRETEVVDKTSSFVSLASRMEQALTGDLDLKFLSLKKSTPMPTTPKELRERLRLIQGSRS
jgi:hypothetical protein